LPHLNTPQLSAPLFYCAYKNMFCKISIISLILTVGAPEPHIIATSPDDKVLTI
jgi:hypothetical protein